MSTSRRHLLAGSAALFLCRAARADASIDALLARIARARAPVRTLQGPFTQTRSIGLLATEVRSRGTLTFVRPNRLRWELAPPDEVTFWVGPEGLAYKSAHGEARLPTTSTSVAAALEDLRALIGDDLGKLRERWELRVSRDDASGVDLEATPREPSRARLRSMRVALGADLVSPTRTLLVEGPRDKTLIEFGTLTVNAAVDEGRMRPPA